MTIQARPWVALVFKCLAALALIFAFVFFMRMQEEQSDIERYRKEGTVSRAVVSDKTVDTIRYEGRRGRSRTEDVQMLFVRYAPKSKVAYADYPAKVALADLPAAPPLTGDPVIDGNAVDIITVPRSVYDAAKIGDSFVVVDTIYSGDGPEVIDDIRDWDAAAFYPRIAIALVLMLVFAVIGWGMGRKR